MTARAACKQPRQNVWSLHGPDAGLVRGIMQIAQSGAAILVGGAAASHWKGAVLRACGAV